MTKFIIKRILMIPIMLLCVALLVFLLLNISAADPLLSILPSEYTQEEYDALTVKPETTLYLIKEEA